METLRVYRGLLANRALRKLLVGEFVSGIGDWLYIVAIFVVIYRETNDPAAVGAFGAVRMVPYILLSIPAGLTADRFDRRLVLLVSDLVRGAVMVALTVLVATNGPVLLIVAFAMIAASGSTFFYPALGAYLPSLAADERQLGPANSAWASLGNLSFIIGPAIGGILIAAGGLVFAFALNAASFLVIAAILWTLPPSIARRPASTSADVLASTSPDPQPPESAAAETPRIPLLPITGVGLIQVVVGFLDGGIQALTIILAVTVLNAGEEVNGYLNAAIGVGGLAGALVAGLLVLRRRLNGPLLIGAVLTGAGAAALGGVPILAIALVSIGVLAAGSIVLDVALTTIFQRLVPDALRGRALGFLMTANTVSGASGAFVLPVLVVGVGAAPALGAAGIATIAAVVIALGLMGPATARPPSPYEATLLRIAKLPLFAGVRRARLEAALDHARSVDVATGQEVIRQGDPADRFYIIISGSFRVTQTTDIGTEVFLRGLGPDEVFGELGLLNRAPRSATVTAGEPGTLLQMDGDRFLELVGASGDLRGRLLGLYGAGGLPRSR